MANFLASAYSFDIFWITFKPTSIPWYLGGGNEVRCSLKKKDNLQISIKGTTVPIMSNER